MTPNRIRELRIEVMNLTNSAGGPTRYGDWITELLDAVEDLLECQQCGHVECCCDPEVAPWTNELRRLRAENAATTAGLDRALAFLSDCRAENERLQADVGVAESALFEKRERSKLRQENERLRAEIERLLEENLELKMRPVFDEYREYRA